VHPAGGVVGEQGGTHPRSVARRPWLLRCGMCLWPRSQLSCSGSLSGLGVCDTERAPGYLDDAQLPGLVDELVR